VLPNGTVVNTTTSNATTGGYWDFNNTNVV
jgi:hypothetical protein